MTNTCTAVAAEADEILLLAKNSSTSLYTLGNSGLIYECQKDGSCTQYISTHYLSDSSMYRCDASGTCADVSSSISSDYYYISGKPNLSASKPYLTYSNVIQCSEDTVSSCSTTLSNGNPPNGVFLDVMNNKNVVICNGTTCSSIGGSLEQGHAYINIMDSESKSIITCTTESCQSESPLTGSTDSSDFFYISAMDITKIIKWSETSLNCSEPDGLSGNFIDGKNNDYTITNTSHGYISLKGYIKFILMFFFSLFSLIMFIIFYYNNL